MKKIKDDESLTRIFSDGFKSFIQTHRFSQEEIAEACGVSASVVSGWKNGKGLPTFAGLLALFRLGMSPNLMFGGMGGEIYHVFNGLEEAVDRELVGPVLFDWIKYLQDPQKTDVEKLSYFFTQANTLQGMISKKLNQTK